MLSQVENDEESQKRGIVGLLYHMIGEHAPVVPDPKVFKEAPATLQWLPIRFSGNHVCVDHPMMSVLTQMMLVYAGREIRTRTRLHIGTHVECQYSLMSFGIPVHLFPITPEGELKKANHSKWVAKRKVKEEEENASLGEGKIDLPTMADVLLGKGKPIQQHAGNVRLRHLVESYLDAYLKMSKADKSAMARQVVLAVKEHGNGRFLKRDPFGWWVEIDEELARDKVIKTFSTARATKESSGASSLVSKLNQQQKRAKEAKKGTVTTPGCFQFCM
jgi:hypothetical protein